MRNYEKHGHSGKNRSRAYTVWGDMVQRCCNSKSLIYPYYGGRGIKICYKWRNSFLEFLKDMGNPPAGASLDRIDPMGDYSPNNCRWATRKQQSINRRGSSNSKSKYKGVGWHSQNKCWRSYIKIDAKYKHLGLFKTEEEAALAYNKAAYEAWGEDAYLNIIEETSNGKKNTCNRL